MATPNELQVRVAALMNADADAKEITHLRIAEVTGIPHSSVNRYLNTGRGLTVGDASLIAEVLGTKLSAVTATAEEQS